MRTDRGWRRFYAAGWLISGGITLVAFGMWQLHLREVEQRAEELIRFDSSLANFNAAVLIINEHVRTTAAYASCRRRLVVAILDIESMEI